MELFSSTDSVSTWHLFPNLVHCSSRIITIVSSLGSENDEWGKLWKIIRTRVWILQSRGRQTYSMKGQIVNILGLVSHTVFVATTYLCHYSLQAATDHKCILWLCSNKTLFTEICSALHLIHRQQFTCSSHTGFQFIIIINIIFINNKMAFCIILQAIYCKP